MAELPKHRLEETERKLLTLFAIKQLGPSLNLRLIAFMAEGDLMNYFDLQTSLYELTESGQLWREEALGDYLYGLTPLGEETLDLYDERVRPSLKEQAQALAPAHREQAKREKERFARVHHEGKNEYHAKMGLKEGGLTLLSMDLSLPTAELAQRFADAWPEHAQAVYDFVLNRLSGGEDA